MTQRFALLSGAISSSPAARLPSDRPRCQPAVAAVRPDKERPASTPFLRNPLTSALREEGLGEGGGVMSTAEGEKERERERQ